MSCVQGGDLFDAIVTADKFRYTEATASNVMRQLLSAVNYMHSLHIAHRNIRLENILVSVLLHPFFLPLAYAADTQPLRRGIRCGVEESKTAFKLVYRAAVDDVQHGLGGSTDAQWVIGVTPH